MEILSRSLCRPAAVFFKVVEVVSVVEIAITEVVHICSFCSSNYYNSSFCSRTTNAVELEVEEQLGER